MIIILGNFGVAPWFPIMARAFRCSQLHGSLSVRTSKICFITRKISPKVVVSTFNPSEEYAQVKLDHYFPKDRGEKFQKIFELPPPSSSLEEAPTMSYRIDFLSVKPPKHLMKSCCFDEPFDHFLEGFFNQKKYLVLPKHGRKQWIP